MSLRSPTSDTQDIIWPVEEWIEREAAKYPLSPSRVRQLVDMQALNYVDPTGIDDNLLCPICKVPFVTPVTTPCDHTFCFDCVKKGYEMSETCAVDRKPFRPRHVKPASRIIRNQLDALLVECPNTERGCTEKTKREDLVMHVHRCDYTLTRCPDKNCDKQVVKWLAARDECLHYEQNCIYCEEFVEMAWMQEHVDNKCPKNQATCPACNEPARKSDIESHRETRCPEADALCEFAEYGCRYTSKRKQLPDHQQGCPFQVCAALGKTVKAQQTQIERLKRESDERDRLIWELQQERHQSNMSWDDFRLHPYGPKFRSAEEAMMGIYEEVERRIEGVNKGITDLEGRQTVMVLNEVMPIKNEITEIRSNMGILKIHVAWLMNKSREEVERNRLASQAVNSANTGAGASQAAAGRRRQGSDSDAGPSVPRRLSDGSNGIPRL
jgi:TRAF-type zinc finger protein/C3HC4-type zinc finger (RING finger) protein